MSLNASDVALSKGLRSDGKDSVITLTDGRKATVVSVHRAFTIVRPWDCSGFLKVPVK